MRRNYSRAALAALAVMLLAAASPQQPDPERKTVTIGNQQVNIVKGNARDLPAAFLDKNLCEGGVQARDARNACLRLNSDGSGEWENDAGPGQKRPPARVTWWLLADSAWTITRIESAERESYIVIFEFIDGHWSYQPGDFIRERATLIKGARPRVVVHSKYRDL